MNKIHDHIILFDGVCNLCNGIVKFIIKRDKAGKFKFAALQSGAARLLLNKFGIPADQLDTFIYVRYDKALNRSSAALFLLKELGGFYRVLFCGIIFPKFFRDFFYKLIARSRYKIWGRRESMAPEN